MEEYEAGEKELFEALHSSDGKDNVAIYITDTKQVRKLPPNQRVQADEALVLALQARFGKENIKLV
jgi:DNA polymerase-3 subunit alpha